MEPTSSSHFCNLGPRPKPTPVRIRPGVGLGLGPRLDILLPITQIGMEGDVMLLCSLKQKEPWGMEVKGEERTVRAVGSCQHCTDDWIGY